MLAPAAVALHCALLLASGVEARTARPFDHSHARLGAVLARHVSPAGVDYPGLRAAPAALDGYLAQLVAVSKADYDGWSKPQRAAFWLNLYNAFTLKAVRAHPGVASIRDIGPPRDSAWHTRDIPLGALVGRTAALSLDEVEHEVLRKQLPDARHHFALVCAARSCPELRREPYLATRLDAQLDEAGRRFLSDTSKNELGPERWRLSAIFDWFSGDFERDGPGLIAFVRRFAPAGSSAATPKIEYLPYDWSLNGRLAGE